MATSGEEHNSKPPTAAQEGLASCTARRQSADGRQDTRSSTPGLASDEREGKEQERLSLPDRPKPTAKSHLALPVVTELVTTHPVLPVASEPQCAPGMAGATAKSLPCPGDDRPDLLGLACSDDGEAAGTLETLTVRQLTGIFRNQAVPSVQPTCVKSWQARVGDVNFPLLATRYTTGLLTPKDYAPHFKNILHRRFSSGT